MAVIDELVVSLALDPAKFNEAQKAALAALQKFEEQAGKSATAAETHSKKLLEFFTNIKREALGLVAAFYGGRGLAEVVDHITKLDSSTARLAHSLGQDTHELALWQNAVYQIGGAAEDAQGAIAGLTDAWHSFQRSGDLNSPFINALRSLGVRPEDYGNPIEILKQAARARETIYKDRPADFRSVIQDLPIDEKMLELLDEGFKQVQVRLNAAEKAGVTTGETGFASERFITSMRLLETAAFNVARVFLDKLIPAMDALTALLPQWLVGANTPEGTAIQDKLDRDLHSKRVTPGGLSQNFANWVDYGMWGLPTPTPAKPGSKGRISGNPFDNATGWYNETTGQGGSFGAKGAAAIANTNNSQSNRTSTSTSETNIGDVYINAPNATDSKGIAGSIEERFKGMGLGAASVNSAY